MNLRYTLLLATLGMVIANPAQAMKCSAASCFRSPASTGKVSTGKITAVPGTSGYCQQLNHHIVQDISALAKMVSASTFDATASNALAQEIQAMITALGNVVPNRAAMHQSNFSPISAQLTAQAEAATKAAAARSASARSAAAAASAPKAPVAPKAPAKAPLTDRSNILKRASVSNGSPRLHSGHLSRARVGKNSPMSHDAGLGRPSSSVPSFSLGASAASAAAASSAATAGNVIGRASVGAGSPVHGSSAAVPIRYTYEQMVVNLGMIKGLIEQAGREESLSATIRPLAILRDVVPQDIDNSTATHLEKLHLNITREALLTDVNDLRSAIERRS